MNQTFCWECYSCVKACPQNAIDARGYADFAPMGHSVRVLREEEKELYHGRLNLGMEEKRILYHLLGQHPWGSIKGPAEYEDPNTQEYSTQQLAHEPDALKVEALPTISRNQFVEGPL